MTVTLPDRVNILWTILSGLHLAEYVTKSISKFMRNVNKTLFSHYRLENGGHISRPQCANILLLKQNSFYFADDFLIYMFRICFTFAYAIVILQNEFEIMVCKISAILSLPGCVNTLWQRQSDLYFGDNIFNFISNFRWNLKWQSCFGCIALRARQNGAPFKMIYSNEFSCMELFHYYFIFQIWLKCISKSLWRHQMETLSALLGICAGNSPVPGELLPQRPVTRSFDIFFDLRLNIRLSKQSWGWWFETLSRTFWRHRNVSIQKFIVSS